MNLRVLWSLSCLDDPIDRALRLERSFPGSVESFRDFITGPTDSRWGWMECTTFACLEETGSLYLTRSTLVAQAPLGTWYTWRAGTWVLAAPEVRELLEGGGYHEL